MPRLSSLLVYATPMRQNGRHAAGAAHEIDQIQRSRRFLIAASSSCVRSRKRCQHHSVWSVAAS